MKTSNVFLLFFFCLIFFPKPSFADNEEIHLKYLHCAFNYSSDQTKIGEKIVFIDLDTSSPRVVHVESGFTGPTKKEFESKDVVTLVLVAFATGSVESYIVNKSEMRFVSISAGDAFGSQYVTAGTGTCNP